MEGIIDGEDGGPVVDEPLVPWWSFTKTVLAGAALALVGAGRLKLDEPMAGARYTLRQLLQHTSGLPDYGPLLEYHAAVAAGVEPWSIEDLLRHVNTDELLFEPGTSWAYSNIGYLFVKQTIERATNLNAGAALRTVVLEPLRLERVVLARSPDDLTLTAWGNARRYDPRWVYHGLLVGPPSAAASLLHELLFGSFLPAHLKVALLNGVSVGGPRPGRPFVAPSCGLGVMIDPRNPVGLVVGHTGQGPGSSAAVYSLPEVRNPRTFAAFIGDDSANALGKLETHVLNRLGPVGLCASCQHARVVETAKGSKFVLCQLAARDPRFPRYPRLPVQRCEGHMPPKTGG